MQVSTVRRQTLSGFRLLWHKWPGPEWSHRQGDYVQLSIVKLGTAMAKVAAEVEQAGRYLRTERLLYRTRFSSSVAFPAAKEKDSPLERMFADFGATPYAKSVPVINGGVGVPRGPGLGADPEDDLIAQFRV